MTHILANDNFAFTFPLSGVLDDQVNFIGSIESVATGRTANYTTDFSGNQHKIYILVNAITTGGDIVITGTTVNQLTGVKTTSDTETITLDTSTTQYYKTTKSFSLVTNVDISGTTGINYDIGRLNYSNFDNIKFEFLGYSISFYAAAVAPDIAIVIKKVKAGTGKKFSIVTLEDIGIDSSIITSNVYDNIRTGADDRSYSQSGYNWNDNQTFTFYQKDFHDYFSATSDNIIDGRTVDEGLLLSFMGSPSGGITSVDYASGLLFFRRVD